MTTTGAVTLEPCPWCGKPPTVCEDDSYGYCMVACSPCDIMPEHCYRKIGELPEAIAAWNRRPALAPPADVEGIAAIIRRYCAVEQEPFGGSLDTADLAADAVAKALRAPPSGEREIQPQEIGGNDGSHPRLRQLTHDQALDALCGCAATVTVLSYQEAIEGYFSLRGIDNREALFAAERGTVEREAIIRECAAVAKAQADHEGPFTDYFKGRDQGCHDAANAILKLLGDGA